jgi:hypothetical protein
MGKKTARKPKDLKGTKGHDVRGGKTPTPTSPTPVPIPYPNSSESLPTPPRKVP